MTPVEQKILYRGVAAGTLIGLALGLMLALVIRMKPELFSALLQ
jgi:tetrahydromethanopterin S-methyltransferase subunit F